MSILTLADPGQSNLDTPTLDMLAASINGEHEEVVQCVRRSLQHARRAGELLLQAKGQSGHGLWNGWLRENLTFSTRTAQAYMQVARRWDELGAKVEANAQDLADFGLEKALRLLAKPMSYGKKSVLPLPKVPPSIHEPEVFVRPSYEVSETMPGTARILATEEDGDQYEVLAVEPEVQEYTMPDEEVMEFHTGLLHAVRRLESLATNTARLPSEHSLLNEIATLLEEGIAALDQMKEAFTYE